MRGQTEASIPRGRVVKVRSSNSYHREVRGSIPRGESFFLACVLPLFMSTIRLRWDQLWGQRQAALVSTLGFPQDFCLFVIFSRFQEDLDTALGVPDQDTPCTLFRSTVA